MAKIYRTPTVASLGSAEVMTAGGTRGHSETPVAGLILTTASMLDL